MNYGGIGDFLHTGGVSLVKRRKIVDAAARSHI
jgi:hypothetical protein